MSLTFETFLPIATVPVIITFISNKYLVDLFGATNSRNFKHQLIPAAPIASLSLSIHQLSPNNH